MISFHSLLVRQIAMCANLLVLPSEVMHILLGCVRKDTDHAVNCYKNIDEINKSVVEEGFLCRKNIIRTTPHSKNEVNTLTTQKRFYLALKLESSQL